MDNKTLAQLYLHAKEQGNSKDIAEYEQQILAIDGFDVEGINAQAIYEEHFSACCLNIVTLTDKHAKKNVDKALECLQMAEDYYSKLQDKSYLENKMGYCYCRVALCYDAKPEGKANIAGLVERALEKEIPLACLGDMCKHKGLSDELRKLINEAITIKQKAAFLDERFNSLKQTLPNLSFVKSTGKGYESSIVPAEKEFCVELFKKSLFASKTFENNPSVADALKSPDAAIEVKLFYLPMSCVRWQASTIQYNWSRADSFETSGTFEYNGWARHEYCGVAGSKGNSLLGSTPNKVYQARVGLDLPKQNLPAKIDYMEPQTRSFSCPFRVSDAEYEAKAEFSKRMGMPTSAFTIKATNRPNFSYDASEILYAPFYAVRIVNGNYIAKGTINAYYTDDVNIEDVASIENGYHSYYGVEFRPKDSVKPVKKHKGIKIFSTIALILAIIAIVYNHITRGLEVINVCAAIPAIVCWVLSFKSRKKVLWGVLTLLLSIAAIGIAVMVYVNIFS